MNSYCSNDENRGPSFSSAVRPRIAGEGGLPTIGPDDEGKYLGAKDGIAQWVPGGNVYSPDISVIRVMDQADYDLLPESTRKDKSILFHIRG